MYVVFFFLLLRRVKWIGSIHLHIHRPCHMRINMSAMQLRAADHSGLASRRSRHSYLNCAHAGQCGSHFMGIKIRSAHMKLDMRKSLWKNNALHMRVNSVFWSERARDGD